MVFTVKQLNKSYGAKTVLKQVSLKIPKNKVTVILGKNGAGKTTLIKLMLGMIAADSGQILYEGRPLEDLGDAYYEEVSAVLESVDNVYPFLTGRQNIEYFLGLSNSSASYFNKTIQGLIDELRLREAIDEPVGDYSRGMLQKLALIIALMTETKVLFLDEPTLGLDFQSAKQLCDKIKQLTEDQDKTIILTSHQAEIIEVLADYVIVVDGGQLVYSGDYQDFLKEMPMEEKYEAVVEGVLEKGGVNCQVKHGNSYLTHSSFRALYEQLGALDLLDKVLKIEKVSPTVEDTLLYFYEQGGKDREAF